MAGFEGEELRLDLIEGKKFPECSITTPRPPRINRLTDKRNFESQASMAIGEGFDMFQNLPERERGESIKSHKFGILQHDELHNEDLMLRAGAQDGQYIQRKSIGFHEDFETPVGVSDTIFAVNSDF